MNKADAIKLATQYRGYSRAIRTVSNAASTDLKLKARIISYLYGEGLKCWLQLVKLDCPEFGAAFDASRGVAR